MSRNRLLLSAVATACLLGTLLSAQAAGVDPTNIPLNSQIGSLRIPLSCTFPIIGKQTLNIKLTGSMATSFSVVSNTLIAAVTPAEPTGVVNVTVQGVGGSSTAKAYTFK
jgi:hypothetical protein